MICQTLEPQKSAKTARTLTRPTAAPSGRAATTAARKAARLPVKATGSVEPASPRVVPPEAPPTGSAGVKLALMTIAVVAVILVGWVALHLVFAVLHILELIGVALVALYIGWVAGVHHGHKTATKK